MQAIMLERLQTAENDNPWFMVLDYLAVVDQVFVEIPHSVIDEECKCDLFMLREDIQNALMCGGNPHMDVVEWAIASLVRCGVDIAADHLKRYVARTMMD